MYMVRPAAVHMSGAEAHDTLVFFLLYATAIFLLVFVPCLVTRWLIRRLWTGTLTHLSSVVDDATTWTCFILAVLIVALWRYR